MTCRTGMTSVHVGTGRLAGFALVGEAYCSVIETDRRTTRPETGGASTLRRDAGRRRSRQPYRCGGPSRAHQIARLSGLAIVVSWEVGRSAPTLSPPAAGAAGRSPTR